jgi:hypothetical protein
MHEVEYPPFTLISDERNKDAFAKTLKNAVLFPPPPHCTPEDFDLRPRPMQRFLLEQGIPQSISETASSAESKFERGRFPVLGVYSEILAAQAKKSLQICEDRTQLASLERQQYSALSKRRNLLKRFGSLLLRTSEQVGERFAAMLDACALQSPQLRESYRGVVSEAAGDQIEVTYETLEGPLKQIYASDQFLNGKLPAEGDSVEARITVSVVRDSAQERKSADFESDLPSFRERASTGRIQI